MHYDKRMRHASKTLEPQHRPAEASHTYITAAKTKQQRASDYKNGPTSQNPVHRGLCIAFSLNACG